MSASAWSVGLVGAEATLVEVEAAIGGGLPRTILVGLPDTALYEARDRCKAAVTSVGEQWPPQLLTINLTPATLPKAGSHYDLAIVSAVLGVQGKISVELAATTVLMGELGLDGKVRPVRGVLPALLAAKAAGFTRAVVPSQQVREASLVEGLQVWGIGSLGDLVEVMQGRPVATPVPEEAEPPPVASQPPDLADVVGQGEARWALEVAAAGRHHLLFQGPPGVGKTMLAERLPGLLPALTTDEALEVSALHSLAGRLDDGLIERPPYADPHHSSSVAALVGGGARIPRPGAISLAHLGVLFLDEAPEFPARVLEALRTPLESGWVTIGRAHTQARYPARFQLVLAANPCPCGLAGTAGAICRCSTVQVRRYRDRLSGPIIDRIDIQQTLAPLSKACLAASVGGSEPTALVAERVTEARDRQLRRLRDTPWTSNGDVSGAFLRRHLPLPGGAELIDQAVVRGRLSGRGIDKVLRLCWTLGDLDGRDAPDRTHVRIALAMRQGVVGEAA